VVAGSAVLVLRHHLIRWGTVTPFLRKRCFVLRFLRAGSKSDRVVETDLEAGRLLQAHVPTSATTGKARGWASDPW
jgi:hypothetical protein